MLEKNVCVCAGGGVHQCTLSEVWKCCYIMKSHTLQLWKFIPRPNLNFKKPKLYVQDVYCFIICNILKKLDCILDRIAAGHYV